MTNCTTCRGLGTINVIDVPAQQDFGGIREERSHQEVCPDCKGTKIQNDE